MCNSFGEFCINCYIFLSQLVQFVMMYIAAFDILVRNLWTIVFWYKMHEIDYLWYIFGYFDSQSDENKYENEC